MLIETETEEDDDMRKGRGKAKWKSGKNGQIGVTYTSRNGKKLARATGFNKLQNAKDNLKSIKDTDFDWEEQT